MSIAIVEERPDSADAVQLIAELETSLAQLYPAESRHGYSVEKLLSESVSFFVVCQDDTAAGCGGVQFYGTEYAEVKRMYVRPQYRGLGLGRLIVNHLAEYSRQRGVPALRLETGVHQDAAIGLYERVGFERIPPFGAYQEDPLSVFFEKPLA
jgi:ribosomal protein S18 acetylase RimI-like enzyme